MRTNDNPLLRATEVLDALFHQSVVVCEGHSDRVLYDEINIRLLGVNRGVRNCLFLNAGSWQNVRKLLQPLRQMGIATAAIVDLDVIRKREFSDLMKAAGVPEATSHGVRQQAGDIDRELTMAGRGLKEGVGGLTGTARHSLEDLLETVKRYGVFLEQAVRLSPRPDRPPRRG